MRCEAVEILPGVYKLGGLRSRVKNVYALTKGPLTIIDPGLFSPVRCIDKSLRHIGYRITDIKFIVATHYHIDHIGSVGALRRKSGAQVIAHELDAPFIEGHRRDQYPHAPWHLKTALLFVDLLLHDYVSKVDIIVRDSQHLTALGDLEIIHTPGHTPGHMCLLDRPRKILFSGDAVQNFDGRITRAKEIYSDDLEADMESLRRLTEVDFVHVLPGDGQPLLHEGKARVARYVKSLVLNP
ncbi:MAG TPA: MBL fold metallo-hydrolase [Candidatus Deferrimicrobium sp.]|nr:MBL fold metallo-hydrolase [Candidatus Deferrimicrobium sp.]